MTEKYKYEVSWGLPPFGQFAEGMKIRVCADHGDELRNTLDALLGEGTGVRVIARLQEATFEKAPPPVPAPTATVQVQSPAPAAPNPPAGDNPSQGACPQCGTGQLVNKFRRGTGEFAGVGCDNYPACNHMSFWVKKK